ncbi:MAG TPA: quinone-dependent dihydroorotate dehydrogenase [Agriterribacter sp.]|nr:quinone-dependent dihydroorotate dehydrogenase [Agriterribacter sp.]
MDTKILHSISFSNFAPLMYKFLRNILFFFPAEGVHYFSMNLLKVVCNIGWMRKLIKALFKPGKDDRLVTTLHTRYSSLTFSNPVGLGAGFDKNAKYLRELECLGFGFVEIGTVTPKPQEGSDVPRLFRLPKDRALINRMGFNNDGAIVIAERLRAWKESQSHTEDALPLIIGGNIGKNKLTTNEDAWKDYEICFNTLFNWVDYFVVNVSSPNTPGLRALQEKDSLKKILLNLQYINAAKPHPKPILLKIAPDLSTEQISDVVSLAKEIQLDGIVATNTTTSRQALHTRPSLINDIGPGGLSGKPVQQKSTQVIKQITAETNGLIPLIASGGIFNGEDAAEKMKSGAVLVQVWTGFIYEGPAIVKKICKHLLLRNFFR